MELKRHSKSGRVHHNLHDSLIITNKKKEKKVIPNKTPKAQQINEETATEKKLKKMQSKSVHISPPLAHVPHPNALVLRVAENQLLPRVEQATGDIVVMASASIHFPSFGF